MSILLGVSSILSGSGESSVQAESVRAARSVHLAYAAPPAAAFYNEVTVEESVPASYFMACGFRGGYFGIQEMPDGAKRVLFSVWDSGRGDDPNAIAADHRVEVLSSGEGVTVKRFGGEGTGAQSFMPLPWKIGETCRFLVRVTTSAARMTFAGYVFQNESKTWKHLATFRTRHEHKALTGLYSFIEDFRRDGKSVTEIRRARFGNGWVKTLTGEWVSLTTAKFTADGNPLQTINAGVVGNQFYLVTGGNTTNTTPLRSEISQPGTTTEPPVIPTEVTTP